MTAWPILATSARAYEGVKLAGAAYLPWIGVQSIRRAGGDTGADPSLALGMASPRAKHPFTPGFLPDILNPKVALFYPTSLPQCVPAGAPVLRTSLLLAMIHNLIGFASLSACARFLDRLRGARLAWDRR